MGDELHDYLGRFGLSEKEIAVYLATLEQGETTVTTIADEVDASRRYVYDLVDDLESRGLLQLRDHVTPTYVEATPPSALVERLE